MDIVRPIRTFYKNNSYILTIQVDLTKSSLAIPILRHDANIIAKEFFKKFVWVHIAPIFVWVHIAPISIVSDQSSDFLRKVFTSCCKLLKIKKFHTSTYHPQADGTLECSHRTLAEYLRHYVDKPTRLGRICSFCDVCLQHHAIFNFV